MVKGSIQSSSIFDRLSKQVWKVLPSLFVLLTCVKILLIPTYRSTDFDVHRNWLAVTYNLPVGDWYFNDVNGTTVHTLDYPPAFAIFEWILSNNPITILWLGDGDRCLELLSDDDNKPSYKCVIFQRLTVIVSDISLWIGAWMASRAFHSNSTPTVANRNTITSFLLIVLNPGLLWLDHIHFQYNGMLLGVLLASLGCLLEGSNYPARDRAFDFYHLTGAALYGLLVNLKHLYLPLAPVYFFYLLRRYCWAEGYLSVPRFLILAFVTLGALVLPWIPFLIQPDPKEQLLQIFTRLFPFGRGLVHDYWAANVWAFFCLINKVLRFVGKQVPMPFQSIPEPTPLVCAILLLVSLLPGMVVIFQRPTKVKLIQMVVYTSLCAFMLAYHVHEKAILTALIPLSLLVNHGDQTAHNFLFWQISVWGLLGLFPLFFHPTEVVFKIATYWTYLEVVSHIMAAPRRWVFRRRQQSLRFAGVVIVFLELLPSYGKWEFLPLLLTSVVCANGLFGGWAISLYTLLEHSQGIPMNQAIERIRS